MPKHSTKAKKHVSLLKHKKKKPKHKMVQKGTVKGQGGYFGDLVGKAGSWLGGMAGNALDTVVSGLGEYKVKANTLMETQGPPAVRNSKTTFAMQHREFISDVYGSTTFNLASYPINPGVAATFPWLASQALSYEQYKIKGMLFEFISTSGTSIGSTNTALGTVIMATEYNSQLPLFTSKFQMENHEFANSFVPFKDNLHPIECAPSETTIDHLYVRVGSGTTYNPLLYDMGIFQIATVGMQAGVTAIGELWVTYDVEFFKPTIPTTSGGTQSVHLYWNSNLGSAPTPSLPYANMTYKTGGSGNTSATQTTIPVPTVGRYVFAYVVTGASTATALPGVAVVGGNVVLAFTTASSTGVPTAVSIGAPVGGGTTTTMIFMACFDITTPVGAAGALSSVGIIGGTFPTSVSVVDFYIWSVGTGFSTLPSRKMVDYDPITLLNKKFEELQLRLDASERRPAALLECKYSESDSEFEVHTSDVVPQIGGQMTQSTSDLFNVLATRLGRSGAGG